jgi:hypothetical protein
MSEKGSYYARVLGTFWRHPRTLGLSMAARGLWVSLLSWSADQRSDGAIPAAALTMVCGGKPDARSVADLLSCGLLVRAETSYTLRDWSQHNITRDEHDAAKEATRKRVAAHRSKTQVTPPVTRYSGSTNGVTSEQEQEQEQDTLRECESRARAPDPPPVPVPLPEADPVAGALRSGYGRRYQAQAGDAWLTSAAADAHVKRAAAWCRAQPSPLEAAERFLDGAFAHEPWRRTRWPWKWLAEDPALTASRSSLAVGTMGEHASLDEAMAARMSAIPRMDISSAEGEAY